MRTRRLMGVSGLFFAVTVTGCAVSADRRGDLAARASEEALGTVLPNNAKLDNPTGQSSSFSTQGSVNLNGAFFQSLGTNGRTCQTCHLQSDGWTISARSAQRIFEDSDGKAPLFEFDGQNCRGADRSTKEARRAASSLMIDRADVRFDKAFPAGGEIEIITAEGTYCNVTDSLSHVVYRRPLPTVNFRQFGTSLWDGHGHFILPDPIDVFPILFAGAVQLHAEGTTPPTSEQIADGMAMMMALSNAQASDNDAKNLGARHALGGAENLANLDLTSAPGFTIFDAWTDVPGGGTEEARRAVARGQAIFNTKTFQITGVGGLADRTGTCSGCHSVANQGNQSTFNTLDIGISDASRRPSDLPLYTLRNTVTGAIRQTSDAGMATVTGLCADAARARGACTVLSQRSCVEPGRRRRVL
jgi:cytochrome c peroxidase